MDLKLFSGVMVEESLAGRTRCVLLLTGGPVNNVTTLHSSQLGVLCFTPLQREQDVGQAHVTLHFCPVIPLL